MIDSLKLKIMNLGIEMSRLRLLIDFVVSKLRVSDYKNQGSGFYSI